MRGLPLLLLVVACGGPGKGTDTFGEGQIATSPTLSELPSDPGERDALLHAAQARPGPEQRQGMSKRERKVERGAAIGAAILGEIFSRSPNATVDWCWCATHEAPGPWSPTSATKEAARPVEPVATPSADLVPWVTLPTPSE